MIRHVIFLVCRDDDPVEARRIARIADRLSEAGVTVKQHEEEKLPRINVGTIGHISRGRVNVFGLGGAIMGILAQRDFSYSLPEIKILPQHISRSSNKNHFEKLSQVHSARSRQKIVRTGLTPRVVKRKRVRFHFRFQ